MSDPKQNLPVDITITEAMEKLDEFRQKIIDESYEELVEEGEIETTISVEVMESLDVLLYYVDSLSNAPKEEDEF